MAIRADDLQHFSVDEYLRLYAAEPDALERTELLNGVIFTLSPESRLHATAVRFVDELLNEIYGGRSQRNGSVQMGDSSLWDPDVYVLRSDWGEGQYLLADEVELVVEVCLNTQARDLHDKLDGYAAAGIPTYWVISPTEPGWAIVHGQLVNGAYHSVQRVDLPHGYSDLTTELVQRLTRATS